VLYLGGRLAIADQLQLGTLVALTQYATRSYQPITGIASTRMRILNSAVALDRVREFVDSEVGCPAPMFASTQASAARSELDVVLDNVWFRYPVMRVADDANTDALPALIEETAPWTLRGISFHAQPGSKLAIVGESGAGKTTIAYLLAGLFRPDRGTVIIGGTKINDLSPAALRKGVGLITPDAFLFSGSVMANVRYARPEATEYEIFEACRAAGAHDDIQSLPEKYQTILGERGYRISGGQKQRIALARTLLCGCPVVVLDEATSHIESERDEAIQRALMESAPDRVLIVVAHRLSTVVDADEILVLADGEIVERGRHSDLEAANGRYKALFRSQRQPEYSHVAVENPARPGQSPLTRVIKPVGGKH
jgi:ATP-binding cassette subfamily B protein